MHHVEPMFANDGLQLLQSLKVSKRMHAANQRIYLMNRHSARESCGRRFRPEGDLYLVSGGYLPVDEV